MDGVLLYFLVILFPQYFLPWKTGQARLREMKHVPLKILKTSLEHPAPSLSFPVYRVNGRRTHPCEPDPHPSLRKPGQGLTQGVT